MRNIFTLTIKNIDFEAPPPNTTKKWRRGLNFACLYNDVRVLPTRYSAHWRTVLEGGCIGDFCKLESVNFVNFRVDVADMVEIVLYPR